VIPRNVLVLARRFSTALGAERVASAIARGLRVSAPVYEVAGIPLADAPARSGEGVPRVADLAALGLRDARALVLADRELCSGATPDAGVFEIATIARQGGIPAYGITAVRLPDLFQARMLDLQVVLHGAGERTLALAGNELGKLI
jgi:hypothetical protein